MLSLVGQHMPYVLGTGDYDPHGPDEPWTTRDGLRGSDCAGAAMCWAYKVPRHRPGYNHGSWASVSDDINTNSGIEDAEHVQDLWTVVIGDNVQAGDLIAYPTIHLAGHPMPWIGHVQMIVHVSSGWTRARGYAGLQVAHCHGPNLRQPAVTLGDGSACDIHDHTWGKPEWLTRVLRAKP